MASQSLPNLLSSSESISKVLNYSFKRCPLKNGFFCPPTENNSCAQLEFTSFTMFGSDFFSEEKKDHELSNLLMLLPQ